MHCMCVGAHARANTDVNRSVSVSPSIDKHFDRSVFVSFLALGACTPSRPLLSFSLVLVLALGPGPQSHSRPYGPELQGTKALKATAVNKGGDQETGDRRNKKSTQEGHQPQGEELEGSPTET